MTGSSHSSRFRPAGRGALAAYIVAWAVIGGVVAAGVLALLRDGDSTVALPPVRQVDLVTAADRAACVLRRGPVAEGTKPPNEGRDAPPVRPGTYGEEQSERRIVGALRRGMVVINYRPGLPEADVERLRTLQQAVPEGTIVAPNRKIEAAIAVTAWRRLLTCGELDDEAVDAVRLFRGRYVGSGPNTPR